VKDYNKLWKRAKNMSLRSGFNEQDAEDAAQAICLKVFKGRKTSLKNLFIDHLREQFGSTRHWKDGIGIKLQRGYRELTDRIAEPYQPEDIAPKLQEFSKHFTGRAQEVFCMRFIEGYTGAEIATKLSLSRTRVYELLKQIGKIIRRQAISQRYL
jgi:RNA polymerase sigma factor (sigma-70 family)